MSRQLTVVENIGKLINRNDDFNEQIAIENLCSKNGRIHRYRPDVIRTTPDYRDVNRQSTLQNSFRRINRRLPTATIATMSKSGDKRLGSEST